MVRIFRRLAEVAALAALAALSWTTLACEGGEGKTEIRVFAASSLVSVFSELESQFEAENPSTNVSCVFGGSHVLGLQIEEGARADVFASADRIHLERLQQKNLAPEPIPFAASDLVVIVPQGSSLLTEFRDLPKVERIVLGSEGVPVGRYSREVLRQAALKWGPDFSSRVMERVVSFEGNVRLVRAKVEFGEADAAIVYRTEALSSDKIRIVEIPPVINRSAEYFIAPLSESKHTQSAAAFVAFVRSEKGRAALKNAGFTARTP